MTAFCQCDNPGPCPRYGRPMTGRFWEICQGINVDLGTAAAFRAQWAMEAGKSNQTPPGPPSPLQLITEQAPGDAVAMTSAIYSLHKAYPGRYVTTVSSPYPEVFAHNPDVADASTIPNAAPLRMHYPAINLSNQRGIHFMQGWCEFLGMALGISVPLLTNRPHLYLGPEKSEGWMPTFPDQDFWVVCSGGKRDFTNKLWGHHNYQEVVDRLADTVRFVQVGAASDDHPHLSGVDNMVGSTTLRQLFALTRRAQGVLCGVSLLMHVAAALDKPAIVIAGGREPVQWNAYPKQHYLHTIGMLPCTCPTDLSQEYAACWRSRVQKLGDNTLLDRDTCLRPLTLADAALSTPCTIPECMSLISPQSVVDLILRYNDSRKETVNGHTANCEQLHG